MAHFAKIGMNGKVIQVLTMDNEKMKDDQGNEIEAKGQEWLERHNNWPAQMWIQTSYNTQSGQHKLGGTPLRGNYAGVGYEWDEDNNIFWPKKPHASWSKNITTASWDPPITYPSITTYNTTWTQSDIDNGHAPEGVSAGDARNDVTYGIYWDEAAYQADNNTGWKATKLDQSTVSWNGSSWAQLTFF